MFFQFECWRTALPYPRTSIALVALLSASSGIAQYQLQLDAGGINLIHADSHAVKRQLSSRTQPIGEQGTVRWKRLNLSERLWDLDASSSEEDRDIAHVDKKAMLALLESGLQPQRAYRGRTDVAFIQNNLANAKVDPAQLGRDYSISIKQVSEVSEHFYLVDIIDNHGNRFNVTLDPDADEPFKSLRLPVRLKESSGEVVRQFLDKVQGDCGYLDRSSCLQQAADHQWQYEVSSKRLHKRELTESPTASPSPTTGGSSFFSSINTKVVAIAGGIGGIFIVFTGTLASIACCIFWDSQKRLNAWQRYADAEKARREDEGDDTVRQKPPQPSREPVNRAQYTGGGDVFVSELTSTYAFLPPRSSVNVLPSGLVTDEQIEMQASIAESISSQGNNLHQETSMDYDTLNNPLGAASINPVYGSTQGQNIPPGPRNLDPAVDYHTLQHQ